MEIELTENHTPEEYHPTKEELEEVNLIFNVGIDNEEDYSYYNQIWN